MTCLTWKRSCFAQDRRSRNKEGETSGVEPKDKDQGVCPDFLENYENVKDKICYLLVNVERNADVLKNMPHVRLLDVAIAFFVMRKDAEGRWEFLNVTNELARRWVISTDQLMEVARKNTPRLFPPSCVLLERMGTQSLSIVGKQGPEMENLRETGAGGPALI